MEKVILWDAHINEQFPTVSETQLDSFIDLLIYFEENNILNVLGDDLYSSVGLWEWLSSKTQINLNDIKREIQKKISRATKIAEKDYYSMVQNIGVLTETRTLALLFDSDNILYISTLEEYYAGLRKYLAMEKKNDFLEDMVECFPNIYFANGVNASVNSLNRDFEELREEIVEHLTLINNYHSRFVDLLSIGKSNQEISREFYIDTGVECSPQAGREGIQNLKISCYNEISEQTETVKCELHTKFKKFNIDMTKQDRIYFFPGRPGIKKGKIIVKHIGQHL